MKIFALGLGTMCLSACASQDVWTTTGEVYSPAVLGPLTEGNRMLLRLPSAAKKISVAVYAFSDQTGQMKYSDNVQTLSRAVTQGGASILVKALLDAGDGQWFKVTEREKVDNLVRERRIIAETRQVYNGEKAVNPQVLPPLASAGILLDGGIIGYDFDTLTGGAGAHYLGIGGDVTYRQHVVTVSLRAISTKTGEVLGSVLVRKSVLFVGVEGGVNKYVSPGKLLDSSVNFTKSEPDQIAVQEAIEKAVYTLILDGTARGLWSFKDKAGQSRLVAQYRNERSGTQNGETGTKRERE